MNGNASADTPCAKPRKDARRTAFLTARPLRESLYWHVRQAASEWLSSGAVDGHPPSRRMTLQESSDEACLRVAL